MDDDFGALLVCCTLIALGSISTTIGMLIFWSLQ